MAAVALTKIFFTQDTLLHTTAPKLHQKCVKLSLPVRVGIPSARAPNKELRLFPFSARSPLGPHGTLEILLRVADASRGVTKTTQRPVP